MSHPHPMVSRAELALQGMKRALDHLAAARAEVAASQAVLDEVVLYRQAGYVDEQLGRLMQRVRGICDRALSKGGSLLTREVLVIAREKGGES